MFIEIYVVCLASYRAGNIYGRYIDTTFNIHDIYSEVRNMLKESPVPNAKEWGIYRIKSSSGNIRSFKEPFLDEYLDEIVWLIEEKGDVAIALLDYFHGDIEDAKKAMVHYVGKFDSVEAYLIQFCQKNYNVPGFLTCHIRYEGLWRDMKSMGYFHIDSTDGESIYIFSNC